ncbi:MAG TPA: SAM-dependent methyltransferase, partial [Polyangiaceae bacterium]|nr:SAM-dependent methyltransferase [Polyangiaceae bacterium]
MSRLIDICQTPRRATPPHLVARWFRSGALRGEAVMKRSDKARLDSLLVERGLAPTRTVAVGCILAGRVFSGERRLDKPGTSVARDIPLSVRELPRYVSRGGIKLEGALRALGVDPSGKVWLDIGASTGGFTDCLLQHGALRVYAVDVGRGQLAEKLRQDPRVVSREG